MSKDTTFEEHTYNFHHCQKKTLEFISVWQKMLAVNTTILLQLELKVSFFLSYTSRNDATVEGGVFLSFITNFKILLKLCFNFLELLYYLGTPQIIGNNETITKINVHESGKLICKAKGYPKIKFQWKVLDKNNLLGANQKTDHLSVSTTVYSSRDEVGFSVLTINVVSKEYFGKYTCIATNIAGYDNRDVTLEGIGR